MQTKKVCEFDLQALLPIGLTFVVLGIGIAYGLNVMGDTTTDMVEGDSNYGAAHCTSAQDATNCTGSEVNASVAAIQGVAKIPEKLPLIATVVVAAVIIGILTTYLMVRM